MDGEVMAPGEMVRAVGKAHPLSGARIDCFVRAGSSITEILIEALSERPDLQLRRDFIVHIDGHPIEEKNWSRVRVKKGATVTFTPRLQGSDTLRTVLGVVVAVAALIVAPYAAGLIFAAGSTALTVGSALIAGGIILAGTLALNALFPVAPAAPNVDSVALNSIQGAQNQSNPFGPVPVVLGTHLQSPFYAAKPYTEIVGDDQWLRVLFCLGHGPLQIENMQIGASPISYYSDFAVDVRQGFVGDPPITLYPGQVDELPLAVTLSDTVDPAGVQGGNGVWADGTTSANTDEISLDFTATQGIAAVDGQGNPYPWSAVVGTRYRPSGSSGAWTPGPSVTFTRSYSPTRMGVNFPVVRGLYEVQVQKQTGDGDPQFVQDTIVWTALRSMKYAPPISFPKPLALVALRIRASGQLSGVLNTFNCICTSLVNSYSGSGSTWNANTPSQNPADLFRHVLQGPANARPVADSQIDIDNLQDWWTYCTANGFKFNQVVTSTGSVYDQLYTIATTGRAVPTFIDGKWGVIWDQPAASIVQHFTPRNSWGFQGQHPYAQQPDGWRVSFINEDNGYTQDERIVYDDGFDATNATLFEGIQFPGVTDPALIWKHGRYQIAQSRLRPEKISLSVGWEHLICTRGDRVRVTHDVLLIGLASGRVKSVVGQVVSFDEMVTIQTARTYGVQFRIPDDARIIDRAVDPSVVAGEYLSLTLVGDLSSIVAGNLFAFGETNQESSNYRVQGIAHQKDLVATLTLVDDAPAISTADQGVIPPYNPNITIPPDPLTLPPEDLRYLFVIQGQGTSAGAVIRLTWQVPRFGNIATFEIQQRDDFAGGDWVPAGSTAPPTTTFDVPLLSAGMRSFRVRCDFSDGTVSAWAELDFLPLTELTTPLANVTNLRDVFVGSISQLLWDEITADRPFLYQVSKGGQFQTSQVLRSVAHPPFATQGDGTYWVTAVAQQIAGVTVSSAVPAEITIATSGSVLVDNVIATFDEAATGWKGSFTGGAVTDGVVVRTSSNGDFLGETDFLGVADFLNANGSGQISGTYTIPNSHIVQLTSPVACKVTITWAATGQAVAANFLNVVDFLGQVDFLGFAATSRVDVYPQIRTAQSLGAGAGFLARTDFLGTADFLFDNFYAWGPWQKYETGSYIGLAFEAQLVLTTSDPQTIAEATAMTFSVDVPDREDPYNLTLGAAPYPLSFSPAPFNGGPGDSPVPIVQAVVIYNGDPVAGDQVAISDVTLAGLTARVLNGGVPVARNMHLTVQGF